MIMSHEKTSNLGCNQANIAMASHEIELDLKLHAHQPKLNYTHALQMVITNALTLTS